MKDIIMPRIVSDKAWNVHHLMQQHRKHICREMISDNPVIADIVNDVLADAERIVIDYLETGTKPYD